MLCGGVLAQLVSDILPLWCFPLLRLLIAFSSYSNPDVLFGLGIETIWN